MAANVGQPNREELIAHLRKHGWTPNEAKDFASHHADLIGIASYDDWEDLSVQYLEAQA